MAEKFKGNTNKSGMKDHSFMPPGVSKSRGVGKVNYGSVGANVKKSGIDKIDAKRGKK